MNTTTKTMTTTTPTTTQNNPFETPEDSYSYEEWVALQSTGTPTAFKGTTPPSPQTSSYQDYSANAFALVLILGVAILACALFVRIHRAHLESVQREMRATDPLRLVRPSMR